MVTQNKDARVTEWHPHVFDAQDFLLYDDTST